MRRKRARIGVGESAEVKSASRLSQNAGNVSRK